MITMRFACMALARFLAGGLAVACILIAHGQAQPINPPLAPPQPTFNPSTPNTVPQPSYTPSSSARPSSASYVGASSANGHRRHRAHSHRWASVAYASGYYRAGPIILGPPPIAYSYVGDYPCAWQRSWDGYWFRTSPCSR
jgi:hypothetical protein